MPHYIPIALNFRGSKVSRITILKLVPSAIGFVQVNTRKHCIRLVTIPSNSKLLMLSKQFASDFTWGNLSTMHGDLCFSDGFCRFVDNIPYSTYYPPMDGPLKCYLKEGVGG